MVGKPEKYKPTKEPHRQPKGKKAPKVPVVRVFPYRVADETGQAKGSDAGAWLRAGAIDLNRGNPVGAEAFATALARDLNLSPSQTAFFAQRIHDVLSNDNLPSTAIRRPFLFYRWSTPTPLGANAHNWALDGGFPDLILQRVSATVPGVHVTGIALPTNGKHHIFVNAGSQTLIFDHESASSDGRNRIISPTGGDISFPPNAYIETVWDELTARWRFGPLGAPGSGSATTKESHVVLLATEPEAVCV